jgi:hypothetical protein
MHRVQMSLALSPIAKTSVFVCALLATVVYTRSYASPRATSLPKTEAQKIPAAPAPDRIEQSSLSVQEMAPEQTLYQEIPQAFTQATEITPTLTPPKDTACSIIWNSYPEGESPPPWLSTPATAQGLESDIPYNYLAGKLIQYGLANADSCPANGLLPSGYASPCGLEKTREAVRLWQNQFDEKIFQAAVKNAVPAQLLKRIFGQESQFWFGESGDGVHFGPGQTTEPGLDPLFLWYPTYYNQVCPAVFPSETCQTSYGDLPSSQKAMIRGYFLSRRINISCPSCANKVDLIKATDTIDIFAKLLIANCQQVNLMVTNLTGRKAGTDSSYEDLWRFTLANYNAGAGCISGALESAFTGGELLDWASVSSKFSGNCTKAVNYVTGITQ